MLSVEWLSAAARDWPSCATSLAAVSPGRMPASSTPGAGGRAFAKAGGAGPAARRRCPRARSTDPRGAPYGMPAPRLVGFAAVDGWSVLVLAVVAGRLPGQPWTPDEVDAVHRACLTMAEL